jgi:hypothetical protein
MTAASKSPSNTLDEDVEGFEPAEGSGWGDYPLDSVFVRHETRSVSEVVRRIDAKRYILDPEFQRDFVWSEDKQSKLIESCVMRIPLPVFYLAEAPDGRIIVVDGLQRLATFHRFVGGQLRLKGLASDVDSASSHILEGKRFKDLPLNLQERILDTQLITYILDAKAPERARLDIFERVNSGEPLTRQQMRNALYNGPATIWLRQAAESDLFRKATGGSLRTKTMRDREAINRFCAFSLLGWNTYKGDMDFFLASALTKMDKISDTDRHALRKGFDISMHANLHLFGKHAFRKSLIAKDPDADRIVLNIALFDVCSVLLSRNGQKIIDSEKVAARVRRTIVDLVLDDDFSTAITYSTNSTKSVAARFEMAEEALGLQ